MVVYTDIFAGKMPVAANLMTVNEAQIETEDHESGQHSSTSDLGEGDVRDCAEKDESVDIAPDTPIVSAQDVAYPESLHGTDSCLQTERDDTDSSIKPHDDLDLPSATVEEKAADESIQQESSDKDTAPVQEIVSAEQESTLVRSALRSSLDGEDAELLNNFLTKAKAKRDAKAAMAVQDDAAEEEEKAIQEEVAVPDIPTPRSRRVLEELDANSPSPSPQKTQALSPRKAEGPPPSPIRKDIANQDENGQEQQPSSPATRRSTRVRAPPRTTIPAIRNTLSLRRAKGTEFVFLQRTEAQELALATRKNTRQNKGTSVLPKYALKSLARKPGSSEASPSPDDGSRKTGAKRVCWNDARLVEFEDGGEPQSGSGRQESSDESASSSDSSAQSANKKSNDKRKTATGTSRSTRSQRVPKDGKSTSSTGTSAAAATSTTASTTATPPPARRVRRLGNNNSTTATTKPEESASSSPSSSKGTSTPTGRRRKLTPRSPSTTLFGSPASKKNTPGSSTSTSTSTPASKIPTTTSSGAKSKSIFKASAGSTPMPKRVRSRT